MVTENEIEVPVDFTIEFLTFLFVGTIRWWVTSNTTMKPNDLAKLTIKLVRNGHLKVFGVEIED